MEVKKIARKEFNNLQKAQIFARDKAICWFTGKPLWTLDYWVSCLRDSDWVDHIKPAKRGWKNILENWICASSEANAKKRNNWADNKYIFRSWLPTFDFYKNFWAVPKYILDHLKRFEDINYADWYINRSLTHFMITIENLINPYDKKWNFVKRKSDYWAKASFWFLENYRKIIQKENIENFLERLYWENFDFGQDQKIMLKVLNAKDEFDILTIANEAKIYYGNSKKYIYWMLDLQKNISSLENFRKDFLSEKYLPNYDKIIIDQTLKIYEI